MTEERRSHKRLKLDLDSMYRSVDSENSFTTTVINISCNGICLETKEEINMGGEIELKVFLETGEMVLLVGQVKWCHPLKDRQEYSIGLNIVRGEDNHKEQFERYYNLRVLYPPQDN